MPVIAWTAVLLLGLLQDGAFDKAFAEAHQQSTNGSVAEAIKAYTALLKDHPDDGRLYTARGQARRRKGDFRGALADFKKALELDPASIEALIERGLLWEDRKNTSNARIDYERALKIDPNCVAALYNRGLLLRRQTKYKEADKDLKKASETEADDLWSAKYRAYAKLALGNLLPPTKAEDPTAAPATGILTGATFTLVTGAVEDLSAVIDRDPKDGSLYATRASAYISLGKFTEAETDLRKSAELAPSRAVTQFELGRLMEYTGKRKEAKAAFNHALRLDPTYAAAWFGRANANSALGDKKAAVYDLTKAIKLYGKWPDAYFNRANARSALKDYKGSFDDYTKVIKLRPKWLPSYVNRAWCRKQLGDVRGEQIDYRKAAAMEATTAFEYGYRAYAKEELKDLDGAIADCKEAVRLSPEGSAARKGNEEDLRRLEAKR